MDFSPLLNRNIIDVLIGDMPVYEGYSMPYMKGPELCQLSSSFGLVKTYTWGGGTSSRWEYMSDLLQFLNKQDRVGELLNHLFEMKRFNQLTPLGEPEKIKTVYGCIVDGAIKHINAQLLLSRKELRFAHNTFFLVNVGEKVIFEAPKVKVVNYQYIRELPDRIKEDLANEDYDSVITKSRTLLEEVLIYIIEHLTKERYHSSGDLIKIYQEATDLLNMRQNKDWDKRVNELLGGMHKIISSISSMRNMNSDAHGVGISRINIKEKEAMLVANSSMMLSEYWLGVYENRPK